MSRQLIHKSSAKMGPWQLDAQKQCEDETAVADAQKQGGRG
ncbi:hypothetical protein [Limosilactobacillus allomucosae]|uniref:Uncharacterized protein n=1 Tax=Limosilactobacillus allomucosae TaxID=3142938 RepID=A0AAU7C3B6_9LACO